jgi:PPOX class probable F420-dependent enzyme
MRMEPDEARRRFGAAQVARLATIKPDGRPHIVPITFAVEGDRIYSIVDAVKPKSSLSLVRRRNIEANPRVSVLADEYTDDWNQLWWVRADGRASVVADGPNRARAISLLRAKYPQYRASGVEFGAALVIDTDHWIGWSGGARKPQGHPNCGATRQLCL